GPTICSGHAESGGVDFLEGSGGAGGNSCRRRAKLACAGGRVSSVGAPAYRAVGRAGPGRAGPRGASPKRPQVGSSPQASGSWRSWAFDGGFGCRGGRCGRAAVLATGAGRAVGGAGTGTAAGAVGAGGGSATGAGAGSGAVGAGRTAGETRPRQTTPRARA